LSGKLDVHQAENLQKLDQMAVCFTQQRLKGVVSTSLDLSQELNTKPHNQDADTMEVAVGKTKVDMEHLAANTKERHDGIC